MRPHLSRRGFLSASTAALGAERLRSQGSQNRRAGVDALRPAAPPVDLVFGNLDLRFRTALESLRHCAGAAEADAVRAEYRQKLEYSLGRKRLPWPPPLEARITGVVKRDGYRVEKVVYQSLPGAAVPAHCYVPAHLQGRAPAIIFFNGHWPRESKMLPTHQALCINLARQGFIVLNFDPPGQGERGVSTRDHRRAELLLVGVAQEGLMTHETQCGIEYLLSRNDVDPRRLAMTGASGGGFQTWITAALDDRIRAAAPVVGTCDFYEQSQAALGRDWGPADHCHKVPWLNTWANNHELLAMAAPKPVLIVSSVTDASFPIGGARRVFAYGKALYQSYGMPERLDMFEDRHSGHDFERPKREAVYAWFRRWLLHSGDGNPFPEPPTQTEPVDSAEMRCFGSRPNQPAGPGIVRAAQRLAQETVISSGVDYEARLGKVPPEPAQAPAIQSALRQRLLIPAERDLVLPAYLLSPGGGPKGVVVGAHEQGKESLAEAAVCDAALGCGWAFCGVDVRGTGELASAHPNWLFAVHLLLADHLPWRQGWDLAQAARYLSAAPQFGSRPIVLHGATAGASLAACYALIMPAVRRLPERGFILQDGFLSFRQFMERPLNEPKSFRLHSGDPKAQQHVDREIPASYFVFDALRFFDLPQLLAGSGASGLVIHPIDGDWQPATRQLAERLLPANARAVVSVSPAAEIRDYLRALSRS